MATTSYKCLNCGAGIHYKPDIKKFKCDFCLSEYDEVDLLEGHSHAPIGEEKPWAATLVKAVGQR